MYPLDSGAYRISFLLKNVQVNLKFLIVYSLSLYYIYIYLFIYARMHIYTYIYIYIYTFISEHRTRTVAIIPVKSQCAVSISLIRAVFHLSLHNCSDISRSI